MKKWIHLGLIFFLFSTVFGDELKSFEDALTLSAKENKPVLIDVFADW